VGKLRNNGVAQKKRSQVIVGGGSLEGRSEAKMGGFVNR